MTRHVFLAPQSCPRQPHGWPGHCPPTAQVGWPGLQLYSTDSGVCAAVLAQGCPGDIRPCSCGRLWFVRFYCRVACECVPSMCSSFCRGLWPCFRLRTVTSPVVRAPGEPLPVSVQHRPSRRWVGAFRGSGCCWVASAGAAHVYTPSRDVQVLRCSTSCRRVLLTPF